MGKVEQVEQVEQLQVLRDNLEEMVYPFFEYQIFIVNEEYQVQHIHLLELLKTLHDIFDFLKLSPQNFKKFVLEVEEQEEVCQIVLLHNEEQEEEEVDF